MHAICHTPSCSNQGIPIEVPADTEAVVCGVCDQPVTDVTTTSPTLPEDLPPWDL